MQKINKIYYFGNNYHVAQTLDRIAPVAGVYCEKRSFNTDIYNFARLHRAEFFMVGSVDELQALLPKKRNNSLGISFGFGIIFRKSHIKSFGCGIWNIHTGKLPESRGRHPISWGFLENCREFTVCLHEINEDIDRGYLLASKSVPRDLNDTQIEIEKKIDIAVDLPFIKKGIRNYFTKQKKALGKGVYKKNLINAFVSVSPKDHDSVYLFNIFRSQAKYGGVKVNGKRYTDCVFYNEKCPEFYRGYDIFACKDNESVGLKPGRSA